MDYRIAYLADHPEHVNTIAKWYWDEWDRHEGWNMERSQKFAQNGANKDKLDITLLALSDNNECIGTVQIREDFGLEDEETEYLNQFSPWLGSLYVHPEHRGKNIAFKLCDTLKNTITDLNINTCYAATAHLGRFFEHKGGCVVGNTFFANENMDIYEFSLRN